MKKIILCLAAALWVAGRIAAEVPPAEKLLPADTLVMLTVPDYTRLKAVNERSPQGRLWRDPAMKAFVDKFVEKLNTEFTAPLEKELGVTLSNYFPMLQGQLTLAFVQNGWTGGKEKPEAGWLLLLDARDQSGQLKTNLAALKRKWTDSNKTSRTEKIRGVEFTVLKLSTNDLPPTLQNLLPSGGPKFPDADPENPNTPKAGPTTVEVFIGQSDTMLVAGNQAAVIEKVMAAQAGGSAPTLSDNTVFEANRLAMFREVQGYGWVNAKGITELINKQLAKDDSAGDQPSFLPFKPGKVIGALGLDALKSIAFSIRFTDEGGLGEVFLTAAESERRGLLSLIAAESKETLPPAFVPADAVKFQRLRLNSQKTWDNLEKTLETLSPQLLSGLNFAIEMSGGLAKEKNPDYNLKKSLLGSLGDDLIMYEKVPRSTKITDLAAPPAITLIGTTKPEQFLEAVKYLLTGTSRRGEAPKEREFRGRKIYALELPPVRTPDGKPGPGRTLSFATANGYAAFSTDPALLEEFLRGSENTGKPLRETPGLAEAAQKVTTSRTSWLSYENQAETMRATINTLKQTFSSKDPGPDNFGLPSREKLFKEWFDVTLLPDFDRIAKYFHLSVSGSGATSEGMNFRVFTPTPPQLKAVADAKN